MNLRCRYCSTLFALSMAEKSAALQMMQRENMQHYDAYCPRCRRSNPIPRALLERFSPGWQNYVAGSTPAGTPRTAAAQAKPAATALGAPKSAPRPASAGAKTIAAGPAQAKNAGKAKPKPAGKGKPAAKKPSSSKVKAKPAPKPKSTSKAKAKKAPARKKK
jgi:hypothetical protein